jgi:hypothetical protein
MASGLHNTPLFNSGPDAWSLILLLVPAALCGCPSEQRSPPDALWEILPQMALPVKLVRTLARWRHIKGRLLGHSASHQFLKRRCGGPVSWSRRIGPHVVHPVYHESSPAVPVSRLPQRCDRVPFQCVPSFTHHLASRQRRARPPVPCPSTCAVLTPGWYTRLCLHGMQLRR